MEKIVPICENRVFRRMYYRSKSIVTPQVVIYYSKNRLSYNRLGITTGKKIGNAVKRNRSRRIIRQAYREVSPYIRRGYDFVLVARGKTPFLKTDDIRNQLIYQLNERNLLIKLPADYTPPKKTAAAVKKEDGKE